MCACPLPVLAMQSGVCVCAFPLCIMQDGRNALHLAAKGGHVGTIRCLASKMASLLHSTDNNGFTMLHWAAQEGHAGAVQLVVKEYRLDPTACDKVCALCPLQISVGVVRE